MLTIGSTTTTSRDYESLLDLIRETVSVQQILKFGRQNSRKPGASGDCFLGVGFRGKEWWWTQSHANPSPPSSLFYRENTGISLIQVNISTFLPLNAAVSGAITSNSLNQRTGNSFSYIWVLELCFREINSCAATDAFFGKISSLARQCSAINVVSSLIARHFRNKVILGSEEARFAKHLLRNQLNLVVSELNAIYL